MRRQSLGSRLPAARRRGTVHDAHFYGPDGALTADGRPRAGDRGVAREAVRDARGAAARRVYPRDRSQARPTRSSNVDDPRRHGRHGRRRARAQPAARGDGRHRRAAAHASASARAGSTRSWTRSTSSRSAFGKLRLRLKPPRRARRRSTSSAPATCRWSSSTRRSPARAGWAATSTSARPRGRTGATSSTSTSARSPTRRSSTRRARRDELARITNGYSPAMIDQACSLALTYAHSDGRERVQPRRTSSRR